MIYFHLGNLNIDDTKFEKIKNRDDVFTRNPTGIKSFGGFYSSPYNEHYSDFGTLHIFRNAMSNKKLCGFTFELKENTKILILDKNNYKEYVRYFYDNKSFKKTNHRGYYVKEGKREIVVFKDPKDTEKFNTLISKNEKSFQSVKEAVEYFDMGNDIIDCRDNSKLSEKDLNFYLDVESMQENYDGYFISDEIIDTREFRIYDVETLVLFDLSKINKLEEFKTLDPEKILNTKITDRVLRNVKKYESELFE